jgi:5-carboxymethyl-2-hydroxymuconate isomerase
LAHILIEHSANLRDHINLPRFVQAIREAALATGILPPGARTQACEAGQGIGPQPAGAFVHLAVGVGRGRDLAARRQACEHIFAAACEHLSELRTHMPLGISVEMQERELELGLGQDNIHDYNGYRGLRTA